ncbi:unnamed protein product, partial [Meganyctiphanes norvegica]
MDIHPKHTYDYFSKDPKTMLVISTSLPMFEKESTETTDEEYFPSLPKQDSQGHLPFENHASIKTSAEIKNEFHVKDHGDLMLVCEVCGYKSIYEEDIENHKKTHRFVCERCNKTFKVRLHLERHMLIHTAIRKYECSQCDRKFTQESHLKNHNKNHNLTTKLNEHNSSTASQDTAININKIFDYVVNKKYACGILKNERSNIRRLSKPYFAQNGKLFYRHRAKKVGNLGNEYRELLVILDQDEQRSIIKSIHTGSGTHLGITNTRSKILEKFYWKNVGKDVKDLILACDPCDRPKVFPVRNPFRKIGDGNYNSSTVLQDIAAHIDVDWCNSSTTVSQEKAGNIDLIFEYVVNKKYASGMTKMEKGNLRRLSRHYISRSGQLFYHHRAKKVRNKIGNNGDEYREVLVIRNQDEQRRIIESMHMGSGNHLGIERTRLKILEKFYWKNVGRDVREYIFACKHCHKNLPSPVPKINIDMIFENVVNNQLSPGMSKDDKGNLRRVSKNYIARSGQLYYNQRTEGVGDSGNEYKELLKPHNLPNAKR